MAVILIVYIDWCCILPDWCPWSRALCLQSARGNTGTPVRRSEASGPGSLMAGAELVAAALPKDDAGMPIKREASM